MTLRLRTRAIVAEVIAASLIAAFVAAVPTGARADDKVI